MTETVTNEVVKEVPKKKKDNRMIIMWIVVFGIMGNLGLAFHQYVMFMRAYVTDEKAIIFFIDKLGEANFELVIMTITMIMGVISVYYVLKNIKYVVR